MPQFFENKLILRKKLLPSSFILMRAKAKMKSSTAV